MPHCTRHNSYHSRISTKQYQSLPRAALVPAYGDTCYLRLGYVPRACARAPSRSHRPAACASY
eukprot:3322193-Rhodomonas_salina.1